MSTLLLLALLGGIFSAHLPELGWSDPATVAGAISDDPDPVQP